MKRVSCPSLAIPGDGTVGPIRAILAKGGEGMGVVPANKQEQHKTLSFGTAKAEWRASGL